MTKRTETEKRAERRARSAAKYAARSFAEQVRSSASGHNGHSGVAIAVGSGLVNVPATKARVNSLWRPTRRTGTKSESKAPDANQALELLFAE